LGLAVSFFLCGFDFDFGFGFAFDFEWMDGKDIFLMAIV
jgi:hypothetical protein